jgi:hypothetical protein
VVSRTTGLSTGAPRRSAIRCMVQSETVIPPSTRRTVSPAPGQSRRMASQRSRVWNATLSSAARAISAGPVPA